MDNDLAQLADLLRDRSLIDDQISGIIGRPAHPGHIGEYIAAAVFGIDLHPSAVYKASDGFFSSGSLAGQSINIKLYSKQESMLDLSATDDLALHPDFYLVMAGGKGTGGTTKGTRASLSIESVFLFRASVLIPVLVERGVKIGVATSVQKERWQAAMVYPEANNPDLELDEHQRALLAMFKLPDGDVL